jgi:hypothetical protein
MGDAPQNHFKEGDNYERPALVFLIAGQSNAGGVAAFSPEANEKAGMQEKHPANPGTTAKEVGIPTTIDAYPRSYIWKPLIGPFERLTPEKNLQVCYLDPWRHGIELPMAMMLEKRYPDSDICFVKHGPAGHNLHIQWASNRGPDYENFITQYNNAIADLRKTYRTIRVIGLYWDQGEGDCEQAKAYEENLRNLFAALRKDTGIPDLRFFVRKHLFQYDMPDFKPVIEAQIELTNEDPNAHLIDLDLGSNEENFRAWAWSIGNGHLSSKAYLELSKRIMDIVSKEPSPSLPGIVKDWPAVIASKDYAAIVKAYADYMIRMGRDRYGETHSPLFVSAMDRKTEKVFKHGDVPYPHVIAKPYAPGHRRDHKMRSGDRTYSGGNPMEDVPLYDLLFRLTELSGDRRYAEEAKKSIAWFLRHGQSPVTGLYSWGSHMYWDVHKDRPIYSSTGSPDGGYGGHEYGNDHVWTRWEQNPDALTRFAHGIWEHQITDKKTGRFSRHADYHQHKPGDEWYDFPSIGAAFIDVWSREYGCNGDPKMKKAIQTLLEHYRSMRHPKTGAMSWCTAEGEDRREISSVAMNLKMATYIQDAAELVQKRDPELATEMRTFVRYIDDEYLSNDYDKILDVAGKGLLSWYGVETRECRPDSLVTPPASIDSAIGYPLKDAAGQPSASLFYLTPWFPGRSYAGFAQLIKDRRERCEDKHKSTYEQALLDIANIYMTISPEVQFAQYPDNISDVVVLLRYVYKLSKDPIYLRRANQLMKFGLTLFFDEISPLPKISNFDDWYESSTKNESSVEILRQMLELKLDLETLPEDQRCAPQIGSTEQDGNWHALLNSSPDAILQYGDKTQHGLYLSQNRTEKMWQINLSDTITRIPTAEEADTLNGRMKQFSGKSQTDSDIAYGGFKDVPVKVTLVMQNAGTSSVEISVTADLHDTYHDNGQDIIKRAIAPDKTESFTITAPAKMWIRRLHVTPMPNLNLKEISFAVVPRSNLQTRQ